MNPLERGVHRIPGDALRGNQQGVRRGLGRPVRFHLAGLDQPPLTVCCDMKRKGLFACENSQ